MTEDEIAWWEARQLPPKVKVESLPVLKKDKDKEGVPYYQWRVEARSILVASVGVDWVLDRPPPNETNSYQVRDWYRGADRVVFASLIRAVREVPILGDTVRRLVDTWGSSHRAWKAIKAHFIRQAETNRTYLAGKLQQLKPGDSESMESFLNRCQNLVEEYGSYGLEMDQAQLKTQVFQCLSHSWIITARLSGEEISSLPWNEIKERLQAADNARRQSNTKAEDAFLPLGWGNRHGNAKVGSGERSVSPPKDRGSAAPAGGYKGKKVSPSGPKGSSNPGQGGKQGMKNDFILVCYYCKKSGHTVGKCKNKPADWQPSQADKDEADRLRRERMEQSARAKTAKGGKANAASSTLSRPSSPARGSSRPSSPPRGTSSSGEGKVSLPEV
jgi:hypothetical protein